jgi:hypothetical protein
MRAPTLTAVAAAVTTAGLLVGTGAAASPVPVAPAAGVGTAATPAGLAAPAVAVNPTKVWQRLSSGGLQSIDNPALVRSGSSLLVVWHRQDTSLTESIRSRVVSSAGQLGAAAAVVSGWASLTSYPQVINSTATGPFAVFGGIRTTAPGEQFSGQLAGARLFGTSWALSGKSFSASGSAHASIGLAAVPFASDVVTGFSLATGPVFHSGGIPPAAANDFFEPEPGGSTAYYPALALDATGEVWAAWFDLKGSTGITGIRYRQLEPFPKPVATVPASADASGNAVQPDQQVAMVGGAGGPWVAFLVGYPSATSIRLFNLITHRAVTVPGSGGATRPTLAAGPGGRLWVTWHTGPFGQIRTARSNPGVTRFTPVQVLNAPGSSYGMAANGSLGPLDLVVTSTTTTFSSQYEQYYRRVLPALSVTAKYARGRVSLVVTDAGTPLANATVTFGKVHVTTSAKGAASIAVGTKKGVRVITVTRANYVGATVKVKV